MRGHVLALALATVLTGMSVGPQHAQTAVTGLWLATERSLGGLGTWLEFRPDGTAEFSMGAVVEGTYRLSERSLLITAGEPPSETRAGHLDIVGDGAVRTPPLPQDPPRKETLSPGDREMFDRLTTPIQMRRIGTASPGAPPIVGTWQYVHPTGATAFETFTKEGLFLLRVQMQTMDATYTNRPNGVRVKLPNGELLLAFKGDVLVSTPPRPDTGGGARDEGMVFRRALR